MHAIKKISLPSIIMINLNIVMGAGLFINPGPLTEFAGCYGFTIYLIGALLLLPLLITLAQLCKAHPQAGGLYVYAATYLSPLASFASTWAYFLGKTSSAALIIHTVFMFLQQIYPTLANVPTIVGDGLLLALLIGSNIAGISIGSIIQKFFIFIKFTPIIFVILAGLGFYIFTPTVFPQSAAVSLLSALPIGMYALIGFEVTCTIAHMIENPEKNMYPALLGSFFLIAITCSSFQLCMYYVLGSKLINNTQPFISYALMLTANPFIANILNICIYISLLGGVFSTLTSNVWNIHTLANNNHLPYKKLLTKTNKHNVPWISLILQGIISLLFLIITKEQVALQNVTTFSMFICFTASAFACLIATQRNNKITISRLIPLLAIASCSIILNISIYKIIKSGISYPFLIFLMSGILLALFKRSKLNE